MATFVLVHGAWHGGWCWKRVAALLRAAGHEVYTPTLTGLGERAHLLTPAVGPETHARDILGVLEHEELAGVVLVGHSSGGVTVSLVADRAPERLAHLVYLDAVVPRSGESDLGLHTAEEQASWARLPHTPEGGVRPPAMARPFGITDPDAASWLNAHLTPHPARCFTEPLAVRDPEAFAGRRTYIACAWAGVGGGAGSPVGARVRAEAGWDFRELATGHDAMVTAPRELTELLLEVAALDAN